LNPQHHYSSRFAPFASTFAKSAPERDAATTIFNFIAYLTSILSYQRMKLQESPFLAVPAGDWLCSNDLAFAIFDGFPVSPGHVLVTTRRVVETWFQATDAEQAALMDLVNESKRLLDSRLSPKPDGYNVGFNSGSAAGQTVPHVHIHVIPRYLGDMPDPRGGVRHVIPGKGNYLTGTSPASERQGPTSGRSGECVEKEQSHESPHPPPMGAPSLPILADRPEVDPSQPERPRRGLTLSTGHPHIIGEVHHAQTPSYRRNSPPGFRAPDACFSGAFRELPSHCPGNWSQNANRWLTNSVCRFSRHCPENRPRLPSAVSPTFVTSLQTMSRLPACLGTSLRCPRSPENPLLRPQIEFAGRRPANSRRFPPLPTGNATGFPVARSRLIRRSRSAARSSPG
jgi:diadenosine tetraphosphate (Ap4A) HIT family hydrolase